MTNDHTTVGELRELIDRSKKALAEVGETELVETCHVRVLGNGQVLLSFHSDVATRQSHPAVEKLLSFDPVWEHTGAEA